MDTSTQAIRVAQSAADTGHCKTGLSCCTCFTSAKPAAQRGMAVIFLRSGSDVSVDLVINPSKMLHLSKTAAYLQIQKAWCSLGDVLFENRPILDM